jgi:hypothetical protein
VHPFFFYSAEHFPFKYASLLMSLAVASVVFISEVLFTVELTLTKLSGEVFETLSHLQLL